MKSKLFIPRSFSVVGLLILLLSALCGLRADAQFIFQKLYKGLGYAARQTADSGYIFVGSKWENAQGQQDVFLIKTNVEGDTVWTKMFGGILEDDGYSVEQTSDGGYILTGYSRSFPGAGNADAYLIKTNATGDTLWTKLLGSSPHDKGFYVHQTTDGGYIVGGVSNAVAGFNDLFFTKLNSTGDILWSKIHAYNGYSDSYSFRQTSDGGYIVAGDVGIGSGNNDVFLFKADSSGNKLWAKNYGGSSNDEGYGVRQTADNGYIIIGRTMSFGQGSEDVYLIKTNSAGDTTWTRTYGGGGSDEGFDVMETIDGGYLLTGRTATFGAGGDVYLIKTDVWGGVTWSKNFGGPYGDCGNTLEKTNDGGYIIGGYYNLGSATSAYLIKLDASGNSNCGEASNATIEGTPPTQQADVVTTLHSDLLIASVTGTVVGKGTDTTTICTNVGIHEIAKGNSSLLVYPNPFTNEISIQYDVLSTKSTEMVLCDVTGKEIIRTKETTINTTNVAAGFYLLFYNDGNKTADYKLVKF